MVTRILCYGDSNTAGFHSGGKGYEPYANTLAMHLEAQGVGCKVAQDGLSGLTARTMVQEMHSSSIRDITGIQHQGLGVHLSMSKPDLVIIMSGTNDLGQGYSPEDTMHKVAALHKACHSAGIPTVAIAPPTTACGAVQQKRARFARMLRQWSNEQDGKVLHYADAEAILPRSDSWFWESDGLHFTPRGSCELGRCLAHELAHCLDDMDNCSVQEHFYNTSVGNCTVVGTSWFEGVLSAFMG
mmetsp:Transcript_54432/g.100595  ORF Transcript_54432/g.100595 Transcript_54432/m.100595 type:complete len:242 (-) Transcript_54432:150-875(-)